MQRGNWRGGTLHGAVDDPTVADDPLRGKRAFSGGQR